jgi:hypothetical protein
LSVSAVAGGAIAAIEGASAVLVSDGGSVCALSALAASSTSSSSSAAAAGAAALAAAGASTAALTAELERVKAERDCDICWAQRRSCAFMCGHAFCGACSDKILRSTKRCPHCRRKVRRKIALFL